MLGQALSTSDVRLAKEGRYPRKEAFAQAKATVITMEYSFRIEKHPRNDLRGPLLKNEFAASDFSSGDAKIGDANTVRVSTLVVMTGAEESEYSALISELENDRSIVISEKPICKDASAFTLALRAGTFDRVSDAILKIFLMRFPEAAGRVRITSATHYSVSGAQKKEIAKALRAFLLSNGELCEYTPPHGDNGTKKSKKALSENEDPELSEPFINSAATDAVKKYIRTSEQAMSKCDHLFTRSGNETDFSATAYDDLRERLRELDLNMDEDDARAAQDYFVSESREATEMELRIINRSRSERYSHQSLYTVIDTPLIADPNVKEAYDEYSRDAEGRGDGVSTISDIAGAALRLPNTNESENGIVIGPVKLDANRSGIRFNTDSGERILAFDHESNNGRTSIDPTGGASACLGDAMRKLMRIFAEPYDTLRISGIADPLTDNEEHDSDTESISDDGEKDDVRPMRSAAMQRALARSSCDSFSAYARNVGIPCSSNSEYISENYRSKHMEVSAVLALLDQKTLDSGRASADEIKSGDLIVLIGSRTGRDGKIYNRYLREQTKDLSENRIDYETEDTENRQNINSEQARAQIVKLESLAARNGIKLYGEPIPGGNGPLQKKLLRLFSDSEFRKLTLKLHEIDTNGLVIAASALSDGVTLYLDCVPLKYPSLTATEVAFSETCERFLAVVHPENVTELYKICKNHGVLCATVGAITGDKLLTVHGGGEVIASLSSDFLKNGSSDKRVGASVKAPMLLAPSLPLKTALAPLESAKPLKRIFSKLKPDIIGALRCTAELSTSKARVRARRFDSTLSGSSVMSPMGNGKCLAAVSRINGNEGTLTLNGSPLCSAVSVGLFPDICKADPYKGAYFAVTAALARLVASGFSNKGAYIALHQFYPSYKKDSECMGNALAAILGAFSAQYRLGTKSICGDFSLGGVRSSDTTPTTAVFGIALGVENDAVSSEFKEAENKLVLLQPSLDKSGIPLQDEQLEVFEHASNLLASGGASAISVTGISVAEAVMQMCLETSGELGFKFSEDLSAESIFEIRYGAIAVEVSSQTELPKDAVTVGTVIRRRVITDGENEIGVEELRELCYAPEEKVYENAPCTEVVEELDKYISQSLVETFDLPRSPEEARLEKEEAAQKDISEHPHGAVPSQNTATDERGTDGFAAKKILIPVFRETSGEKLIFNAFKELSKRYPVEPELINVSFDHASLRALAKEIRTCGALCIPDGADDPAVIAAILRRADVAKAIAELRKNGGLIYGSGSGFAALTVAGLLGNDIPKAVGPNAKSKEFPVTLADCPISGLTRRRVFLRALPSGSPFMMSTEVGKVYSSEISAYDGRLMAEEAALLRAAENRMIPTVYCDAYGFVSTDSGIDPCASMMAVDSLTSLDGSVFGQISAPERVSARECAELGLPEPLPVFEGMAKYVSDPERMA